MKLRMRRELWEAFEMDNPFNYHLVLSSLYLGKGMQETRDLLNRKSNDPEVEYVLQTALFCGLDLENDRIEKTFI